MEGCLILSKDKTKCTECTSYYYLVNGRCEKNPDKCISYDGKKCSLCEYGYGTNSRVCNPCKVNSTYCNYYERNYRYHCYGYFENDVCIENKVNIENCQTQHEIRVEDEIDSFCIYCNEGYIWNETKCDEGTIDNCIEYKYEKNEDDYICNECKIGYELKENGTECSLIKEIENCIKISDGICSECDSGFCLDKTSNRCVDKNFRYCKYVQISYETGKVYCQECKSGYGLLNDGTCVRCVDNGCEKCDNDINICTKCKNEYSEDMNVAYSLKNTECIRYVTNKIEYVVEEEEVIEDNNLLEEIEKLQNVTDNKKNKSQKISPIILLFIFLLVI